MQAYCQKLFMSAAKNFNGNILDATAKSLKIEKFHKNAVMF